MESFCPVKKFAKRSREDYYLCIVSKNVETLKIVAIGNNVSSSNHNSSTDVISNKCKCSENEVSNENSICSQKSKIFS